MGERVEALIRIPLAFVYGVITMVWGLIIGIALIIHWFYTIILGKRHEEIAVFTNKYIAYLYEVYRYLYLTTNARAWPFGGSKIREIESVEVKK